MADRVKDWELYAKGVSYNNRLSPNYYDTVDANLAFVNGDQWRNMKETKLPKPVFNILKRVITFFVASLTSANVKIHFEALPEVTDQQIEQLAEIANKKVEDLLEKFKMEHRVRDALFDGAITGDYCAHFYWDTMKKPYGSTGAYADIQGEIDFELVDGTNVFFGNGNNRNVKAQPYIIISGRDTVENLKQEANLHSKSNPDEITSDSNYQNEAGDNAKIEVDADEYGKALYIIVYRKKKVQREVKDDQGNVIETKEVETIMVSKCVENAYIYQDIDTELSGYPIAWGNWEKVKNSYHGRAIVTGIIPNQIFINRMFAMVMYHLMRTSFPKAVFNADYISNWTNEVGEAIPVHGLGIDANIKNIAGYLEPGNMSNQITQVIEQAMQYTKDTLGISDAALGNIDPKNTSAIIAVQKSSVIPLENPKANLYEWVEDIGHILFDMIGTYYGMRPIVTGITDEATGQPVKSVQMFDFNIFKDLWLNVKADVGEASYWSEIATLQTLDNLLKDGKIDIINYLERIPDNYIPRKQELIDTMKQQIQQQAQMNDLQAQLEQANGIIQQHQAQQNDPTVQFIKSLPPDVQQHIMGLPPDQQGEALHNLMNQSKKAG